MLKRAFRTLFEALPLATVVGDRALVVHGGLCRAGHEPGFRNRTDAVSLAEAARVWRQRDVPSAARGREDLIMLDFLWSDPHEGRGLQPNARGGNTLMFGGDVTVDLLAREGLALLVRSHDWPRDNRPHGYHWCQQGHQRTGKNGGKIEMLPGQRSVCLTLFTASDYCGGCGNRGAVVVFAGGGGAAGAGLTAMEVREWQPEEAMLTWQRAATQTTSPPRGHAGCVGGALAATVLREEVMLKVKSLIVEHKHELWRALRSHDAGGGLHVPLDTWVQCMTRVLGDFRWEKLVGERASHAVATAVPNPDGSQRPLVCYSRFLARHQIRHTGNVMGAQAGLRRVLMSQLFLALLIQNEPLAHTLAALDRDGDGTVTVDDLHAALSHTVPALTDRQAWGLIRTSAAHSHAAPGGGGGRGSDEVKVFDLLDRLANGFAGSRWAAARVPAAHAQWVPRVLQQVAADLLRSSYGGAGTHDGPTARGRAKSPGKLAGKLAAMNDGAGRGLAQTLAGVVAEFFEASDVDGTGYLSAAEMTRALGALPTCRAMAAADLRELVDYCDILQNGQINYLELLSAMVLEPATDMAEHVIEDALEAVYRTLFFDFRPLMSQAIDDFILGGYTNTRCSRQDFGAALTAVNETLGGVLAAEQLQLIIDTIDAGDGDEAVDFKTFFDAFEIFDTELPRDPGVAGEGQA